MAFGSDRERRAAFRRMTGGGGGDVLGKRRLSEGFVRRGNSGRLLATGASRRDQLLLQRAAARAPEGQAALKRFETEQKRERIRDGALRRAVVRSLGIGAGLALAGGGVALAASPQLRGMLGRRLMATRRVIPSQVVRAPAEGAGNMFLRGRREAARRMGNAAAEMVRKIERWVAGYTPGVNGPLPKSPTLKTRVHLEDIDPNDVVARWQAKQASTALPEGSLRIDESAYDHQDGLADKIDVALKTFVKRRFKRDIDPEWVKKFGNTPTRRSFSETINYRQQGYARVRGLG